MEVCSVEAVDRSTISRWAQRFHEGRLSIENDPKSGQSRTSTEDQRGVMDLLKRWDAVIRQEGDYTEGL